MWDGLKIPLLKEIATTCEKQFSVLCSYRDWKKKNKKLRWDELIVLSIYYIPNGIYIVVFGLLPYKVTKYLGHTVNFAVSKDGWNKGLWG